jgi:NADH-quinone oxidoreductase subunit N
MYTKESSEEKQAVPFVYYFVAVVAIVLNIILGLSPSLLTNLLN